MSRKERGIRILVLLISSIVTMVVAWIMIPKLEPGFLLKNSIVESPGTFAMWAIIMIMLIIQLIVIWCIAGRELKELKKEREEIENKYKR